MIDFNKTRQYTLSIRLSTDGFCFAVHNPQIMGEYAFQPYRIDALKSMTANLKEAAKENEILRHTYKTVNIILGDANYTLVPKEYYTEQYEQEFYQQNIATPTTNCTIMHNVVADEQAIVLFAIENQLHKAITKLYPKARFYASVSPLIDFGTEKSSVENKKYVLVHQKRNSLDLLCFDKSSLLFGNTFSYRDMSDATYYLLSSWSILGLSQTEDTLYIAGQARHVKSLTKEITKFIKDIRPIRPAEEFHSTELARIDEIPFDLQALIACE